MYRIVLALLIVSVLSGCGSKTTDLTPGANEETVKNIPDWFIDPPVDPSYLFATATMTSRDMQMAIQKAKVQALRDLGEQLGTNLASLTKQFREEVGAEEDSELIESFSEATKLVTKQVLNGARIDKKEIQTEKAIYRAYTLMSLPIGEANKALMDRIKANKRLYTEFRATKAFEELDEEVKKYEERGK